MRYIILLSGFFISCVLIAQANGQVSEGKRPKIGLVLSGGGAKGMAHVGVLKVLEEVGLEPDYITGTSMGSIMGGLYSIGYTSEEISHLIETIQWNKVLTNEIPSNEVMMRRKHEYSRFLLEMPIYDGKPGLPSGLIEGQKLSTLFSELAWPAAGVDDFLEFPYPYTCIGTDILAGSKVLLNSGDLSSAMRASMAIPSVFTAVVRDTSHILVDGGVVRNMPVQEVIDMGADLVIGVYVGFDRDVQPEDLLSLTSIIARTSLLSGSHDVEEQLQLVDFLIVPDLEGFTASSFTDGVEIMNRGEEAARAQIERLRDLADSINRLGPPPERNWLPANDSLFITDIEVLTESESMERFVIMKSGIRTGRWLKPEILNMGIDRLFGTLFFDKIEYYFAESGDGHRLVFRIKEKANASVSAAIHYDNTFGPGVILNYTALNTLLEGSRLSFTADISEAPQWRSYYDFHLGKNRGFIGSLFLDAEREELPFFNENQVDIGNYHHSLVSGGMGIRQTLSTNRHFGAELGYHFATLKLSRNIKEVEKEDNPFIEWIQNILFRGPAVRVFYQDNTYDHLLYPTRGYDAHLSYRQSFSTMESYRFDFPDSLGIGREDETTNEWKDPYWHLQGEFESYLPLGNRFSLNTSLSLGLSKDDKPFVDSYYLGGYRYNLRKNQVPFVGLYSHEELRGNYLKEKIAIQWKALPNLYVSGLVNIILYSDELEEFPDYILEFNKDQRVIGAGAGFTYRTPLGPVSAFFGSRTNVWNPIWYLNIGYTF